MANQHLIDELLAGPYPCCLTTLRADGSPYSVVVWCGREGERFTVNAAKGRWLDNLRRDPRLSFVVVDTGNILRHVAVDGRAVEIEPTRATPTSTASPASTWAVAISTRRPRTYSGSRS